MVPAISWPKMRGARVRAGRDFFEIGPADAASGNLHQQLAPSNRGAGTVSAEDRSRRDRRRRAWRPNPGFNLESGLSADWLICAVSLFLNLFKKLGVEGTGFSP